MSSLSNLLAFQPSLLVQQKRHSNSPATSSSPNLSLLAIHSVHIQFIRQQDQRAIEQEQGRKGDHVFFTGGREICFSSLRYCPGNIGLDGKVHKID